MHVALRALLNAGIALLLAQLPVCGSDKQTLHLSLSPAGTRFNAEDSQIEFSVPPVEVLCECRVSFYCSHDLLCSALFLRQLPQPHDGQCTGCQLVPFVGAPGAW